MPDPSAKTYHRNEKYRKNGDLKEMPVSLTANRFPRGDLESGLVLKTKKKGSLCL